MLKGKKLNVGKKGGRCDIQDWVNSVFGIKWEILNSVEDHFAEENFAVVRTLVVWAYRHVYS